MGNQPRKPWKTGFLKQAIAASVYLSVAGTALGQQAQIEEVIVTAQKRAESQQEVPIAMTTLSSVTMEKQGIYNFVDIAKTVPSLTETYYPSANMLILYMRGQGVSDPMQVTSDGSVGMYIDGHYIARPQGVLFDLADTERVEVLRGPQGTLYGRNTTGGAVNLISRKPTGEFGFKQNLSAGSRDFLRSLTTVDLPQAGGVSSKISILRHQQDGYVKNMGRSHDFGEMDELAGRIALRWTITPDLTVDYALDAGTQDSTPIYYQATIPWFPGYKDGGRPTNRTYRPIDLPLTKSRFEGHGLTLTWDISDHLTVKSLTGYRELKFKNYQDYAESFGVPTKSFDDVRNHQVSQEIQLIGDAGDTIKYVGGLYYFRESSGHYQNWVMDLSSMEMGVVDKHRNVKARSASRAVYGQVTWTPAVLNDRMDLTFGARYTDDDRKGQRNFTVSGYLLEQDARNSRSFEQFNPAFTVSYTWSETINTYAKVVTGYKAGGSSESSAVGQFGQTFKPEEVTTWELGLKSDWLDRSLRINAAAFYSKFNDMQLNFVADAFDTSVIQAYNAGKANVTGLELELTYLPTADLMFKLDYTHLRPTFDSVDVLAGTVFDPAVNPVSPYQLGDNIKKLFVLPYAPRDSVFLSMDYTFWRFRGGDLSFNLNYRHQSDTYLSSPAGSAVPGRENYRQNAYGLFNARLTLDLQLADDHDLQLAVWGRNITNREYRTHLIGLGGGGAVGTPISEPGYTFSAVSWSEPPSYGVDVIFQY